MGLSCCWRKWALSQVWLRVSAGDGAVGVVGDGADGAAGADDEAWPADAWSADVRSDSFAGNETAIGAAACSLSWTAGWLVARASMDGAGWRVSGLLQNSAARLEAGCVGGSC